MLDFHRFFFFFDFQAAKMEQQQRRALKAPKFTDIPPDPTTFLADEERDGVQRDQNKDVKDAPRVNKGRALTGRKKFPKSASQNDFPESVGKPNPNWRRDDSAIDEKFTNLTVSVSQDGEFKSVRLTQAPVIGSGRVGPRQITKTQFQPMAQSQSFDKNNTGRKSDRKKPANEAGGNQRSQQWKGNNNSFNSHNKVNQLSTPVSKGTSVQDRLKRTPPMPTPHSDNIVKIENSNYSVDQTNIANQHTMLIHNYAPVNELVPGTQQYAQNA